MKPPSKRTLLVMTAAVAVVATRAGLPALLTWLANTAVRKIPGIRGKVRRVQINFLAPGLTVNGLSVALLNGDALDHRLEVGTVAINTRWNAIFRGALEASLLVDAPQLLFNADGIHGSHDDDDKTQKNQLDKSSPSWQEKLSRLPRFRVASAILTEGEIRVIGAPGERGLEVAVDRLNLHAENITNSTELAPTLMARLSADARCCHRAHVSCRPTFNADLSSSDVDLSVLRNIILNYIDAYM